MCQSRPPFRWSKNEPFKLLNLATNKYLAVSGQKYENDQMEVVGHPVQAQWWEIEEAVLAPLASDYDAYYDDGSGVYKPPENKRDEL